MVIRIKVLANRIIGNSQSSAVPGRSIYDTLHLLRNVFDYCRERNFPCLAVSIDQAKAFDKVNHEYLFHVMKQMGIGPIFLTMVKQLYTEIYSQILVNGFLTATFKVTRSMRQGCGLSPLLFNIAIKPLIVSINQSLLFRGIPIPGSAAEERVACFADDTTILAQNEFSVITALSLFGVYSKASGAEININKTTALVVNGTFKQSLLPPGLKLTDNAKICGLFFGHGADSLNEAMLLPKLGKTIQGLTGLSYTYFGKAQVANIFILSKVWHIATVSSLSAGFMKQAETLIFKFIWKKMERLQRTVVFNIFTADGLGVFHVPSRRSALAVKHLANYIFHRQKRWVPFADYWLAIPMRNFLSNSRVRPAVRAERGPPAFYREALAAFRVFTDRGGTLVDSPSLVKIVYRSLIATIVTPPKAVGQSPPIGF
jgi:hypothetical protein